MLDLLARVATLGTSTTATPDARDATPAGKASVRDAILTLLVTGIVVGAATQGIPISEADATALVVQIAGIGASAIGLMQYVRRKIADREAAPAK